MRKFPKLKSDFALIDIKQGRRALGSYIKKHGPQEVTVTMVIERPWGNDDGTSVEYQATVTSIQPTSDETDK